MQTVRSSAPSELIRIFEPIQDQLDAVEEAYAEHIQSRVQLIPEIGRYIQSSGGKRVRPAVLLMAARLAGYTGEQGVNYASVVEFIHTATLVHDDIIDDADLRRGRAAVHSRWGNDITVLLGDYLYIKSMGMALTYDSLDLVRLLCDVTLRMIEGELYQLTKTGDVDITEEEHLEIIRRKTAYLFGGCGEIGGMLGEVTPEQRTALREYASISGWRSSSSTTSSTTQRTKLRSVSRLAATCERARSPSRRFSCCSVTVVARASSSARPSTTGRSHRRIGMS